MTIQFAMPMYLPIACYVRIVSFNNVRLILSNRTYSTKSYQATQDVIKLSSVEAFFRAESPALIDTDSVELRFTICVMMACYVKKYLNEIKNVYCGT